MNKIEELIKQLCPDGVEWKKLGDICDRNTGINITAGKMAEINTCGGNVRIFAAGNTIADVNEEDIPSDKIIRKHSVIVKSRGNIDFAYYEKPFTHKSEMWSYSAKEICNIKFIYYILSSKSSEFHEKAKANSVKLPQLSVGDTDNYEIPLPPLRIQEEIVSILDKFVEQQEQLEKLIELRKKQYEYYREELLTPKEGWEKKTLGEICSTITDGAHNSPLSSEEGYYMPSVKDMRDNGFDFSDCKKISEIDYLSLSRIGCKPHINDVLIAKDGSMLKYAFAVHNEMDIVILSSIAILTPKTSIIYPDYLALYFKQQWVKDVTIREYSSKGGVPRIVLKNFKKIDVTYPSVDKQKEIVSLLYSFESSIIALNSALEASKARYAHYRDRLLNFN